MEDIIISDTAIFAVNGGKKENESSSIVYRDVNGKLHTIDFEICAENFKMEHKNASKNCIGERKGDGYYFIFYTSGIKTKVVFEKAYVSNIFRYHFLTGARALRFRTLHNLISETRYITYDLS